MTRPLPLFLSILFASILSGLGLWINESPSVAGGQAANLQQTKSTVPAAVADLPPSASLIVTEPQIVETDEGNQEINYQHRRVILRDSGCFVFTGKSKTERAKRIHLKNLLIFDERTDAKTPAITFRWCNNCSLAEASIHGSAVAIKLANVWDFEIHSSLVFQGGIGLEITEDTNGCTAQNLTLEKLTGESILASQSRNLVFDRTCKIHGFGLNTGDAHKTPRTVARFRDCGSVWLECRLMHCVPDPLSGLIEFRGQKTECLVVSPWILRTAPGLDVTLMDVPKTLEKSGAAINMRESGSAGEDAK